VPDTPQLDRPTVGVHSHAAALGLLALVSLVWGVHWVVGLVSGALVLGEQLGPVDLLGFVLVLGGVAATTFQPSHATDAAAEGRARPGWRAGRDGR